MSSHLNSSHNKGEGDSVHGRPGSRSNLGDLRPDEVGPIAGRFGGTEVGLEAKLFRRHRRRLLSSVSGAGVFADRLGNLSGILRLHVNGPIIKY